MDKNSTLQKRAVEVLFKGRDVMYVDTDIKQGDRALAEKPGIASSGLMVRTRRSLLNSIAKSKNKDKKKQLTKKPEQEQQGLSYAN